MRAVCENESLISLREVAMHYADHACYLNAMARVESRRAQMVRELAVWSAQTENEVVQFIGGLTFSARVGRTFDEHLEATYGFAHIQWLHREPTDSAERVSVRYEGEEGVSATGAESE